MNLKTFVYILNNNLKNKNKIFIIFYQSNVNIKLG